MSQLVRVRHDAAQCSPAALVAALNGVMLDASLTAPRQQASVRHAIKWAERQARELQLLAGLGEFWPRVLTLPLLAAAPAPCPPAPRLTQAAPLCSPCPCRCAAAGCPPGMCLWVLPCSSPPCSTTCPDPLEPGWKTFRTSRWAPWRSACRSLRCARCSRCAEG